MRGKILLFVFLVVSFPVFAEEELIGFGAFQVGPFISTGLSGLNSFLQENAELTLSGTGLFIGGWGVGMIGKLAVGGEGGTFIFPSSSAGRINAELSRGSGGIVVGWNVFSRSVAGGNLNILPLIGFGFGGVSIELDGGAPDSTDFEDLVDEPSDKKVSVSRGIFYISPSVFASFGIRGLLVGLRAGFTFDIPTSPWGVRDFEVSGIPSFNTHGFYITLSLGGFGSKKE